jgi:hypothetical protein
MNIDERIEALGVRIEALTQSLELMAHMQRDHEGAAAARQKEWEERFEKQRLAGERTDRRIEVLLTLVEAHESRLRNLEGN